MDASVCKRMHPFFCANVHRVGGVPPLTRLNSEKNRPLNEKDILGGNNEAFENIKNKGECTVSEEAPEQLVKDESKADWKKKTKELIKAYDEINKNKPVLKFYLKVL